METYSPRKLRIELIKTKLYIFLLLFKIFVIRYLKISNRIILLAILLTFGISSALGKSAQEINSKIIVRNQSGSIEKGFSNRSEIFLNESRNSESNHNHYNKADICLREHRIKRDAREDESVGLKKIKDKIDDKEKRLEDEEDDFEYGSSRESSETMSECNSCARDKMRIKSLETIKESILSKLGMSQPPNVTERPKPKIADHLLMMLLRKRHMHHGSNGLYWVAQDDDLDEMQGDEPYDSRSSDGVSSKSSDSSSKSSSLLSLGNTSDNKYSDSSEFQEGEVLMEEEDDFHVRTERIIAFSQPHPKIRHMPQIQYFEFSDRLRTSKVKRAVLWMYIKGRESTSVVGSKITISIYKILRLGLTGSRESPVITSIRANSTQSIPLGRGAWVAIDYIQIKNLVAEWFKFPQHNLGIVISAEDANRTNLAATTHGGNDTAFGPFLEVHVTDNRKHRTKRTVGLNCKDSSKETRCCRYPLLVNFEEFGWDWIIAPKKYEAFYCAGECPLAFLPQHPHTHVSQLANIPGNGPCCAPRKLSELEMLYFDQNMNIIFGRIPAMKVDRCGCT